MSDPHWSDHPAITEALDSTPAESTPSPDPARELAEEIAKDRYPGPDEDDLRLDYCDQLESRLRAFLAERERLGGGPLASDEDGRCPIDGCGGEECRRVRRARALTALDHVLNNAVGRYPGDPHSIQDLLDNARTVSSTLSAFEAEANDAEARTSAQRPTPADPRDAHVIQKIRAGGDRDGEVTHYLVGPQRATQTEALRDLGRYLGAEVRVEDILSLLIDVGQLVSGWRGDGSDPEWSEWDESVWQRLVAAQDDLARTGSAGWVVGPAAAQLATLRGALERIGNALPPDGADDEGWSCAGIIARAALALAPDTGRREAEVLRAAALMADSTEYWLEFDNEEQVDRCIPCAHVAERLEELVHDTDCPIAVFVAYRDALQGGEG